jgi:hypothetical protein
MSQRKKPLLTKIRKRLKGKKVEAAMEIPFLKKGRVIPEGHKGSITDVRDCNTWVEPGIRLKISWQNFITWHDRCLHGPDTPPEKCKTKRKIDSTWIPADLIAIRNGRKKATPVYEYLNSRLSVV